ncbi:MAG: hypothetical protein WAV02_17805 [Stellaceae bacterium]
MTVETKTNPSRQDTSTWTPKAHRHGERPVWTDQPQTPPEKDEEPIFPSITAPPVWPRVFPGL